MLGFVIKSVLRKLHYFTQEDVKQVNVYGESNHRKLLQKSIL